MTENDKYVPINCSFHDQLLHWATKRQSVEIRFHDESNQQITTNSVIKDVFSTADAEFMKLEDDSLVRLDKIISVDGEQLTDDKCDIH